MTNHVFWFAAKQFGWGLGSSKRMARLGNHRTGFLGKRRGLLLAYVYHWSSKTAPLRPLDVAGLCKRIAACANPSPLELPSHQSGPFALDRCTWLASAKPMCCSGWQLTTFRRLRVRLIPNRESRPPCVQSRPNPSLKRSANGRPPGPVWRYAVHFRQPGPGVLPSSPA